MDEIFKKIELLSGIKVEVIIPTGGHYSRALRSCHKQTEYDPMPFIFAEICLIDGKKKDYLFYTDLMIDDYILISEVLNEVSTIIK